MAHKPFMLPLEDASYYYYMMEIFGEPVMREKSSSQGVNESSS